VGSRRAVITGLGVVSPLGDEIESFWSALLDIEAWPGVVDNALIRPAHMSNRLFYSVPSAGDEVASRCSVFAMKAARAACADAALDEQMLLHAGVVLGTGAGSADDLEHARSRGEFDALASYPYRVAGQVAETLGATGPNFSLSTACSAGAYAISVAAEAIEAGYCDVAIAGGAEGMSRVTQACFNRLWALDPTSCRPFCAQRGGTILGEGAAILVLESDQHARERGRTPYARLRGYSWSCDGHHPAGPEPSGRRIEAVVRHALRCAELTTSEIDCLLPHGTGTRLNDQVESRVLRRVFGARLADITSSAIKSKIGHGAGAAGAFSCLVASLILQRGGVPPTQNLVERDPECPVRVHTGAPREGLFRNVLVNSFGFGGTNIALVVGRA